jgi:hypothetical protein
MAIAYATVLASARLDQQIPASSTIAVSISNLRITDTACKRAVIDAWIIG